TYTVRMQMTHFSILHYFQQLLHSLACASLSYPNSEEESIMGTLVAAVLDSSNKLISLFKPGGPLLTSTSVVQGCVGLAKDREKELHLILKEAISDMEGDKVVE
ncbi:hypothetical protein MKW98_029823, partial [Papaver atlanticum]